MARTDAAAMAGRQGATQNVGKPTGTPRVKSGEACGSGCVWRVVADLRTAGIASYVVRARTARACPSSPSSRANSTMAGACAAIASREYSMTLVRT